MRLWVRKATVTGVALCLMAGCSTASDTPSDVAEGETNAQASMLRYGAVAAGGSVMDPHGAMFSDADWVRRRAIYDTLIARDGDGAPVPALAQSWSPSADASEWTIVLRDDATFSSGDSVTATDVLFSLNRLAEKAAENGNVVAAVDLEASAAIDDRTLTVALRRPNALWPEEIAELITVVPEGTEVFDDPVGAGPFVLEATDGTAATLRRSEAWYGGEPGVETLEVRGFADEGALTSAVSSGALDVAGNVGAAAAKTASANNELEVNKRPGGQASPLLMRVDVAPFDDPLVRQAVKKGIDRQALVDGVYLGYGEVGRDRLRQTPSDESAEPMNPDVVGAKELLAQAGYADGLDVTLHTTSAYPAMVPTATLAAEQLKEIGITVTIKEHDPQQFWSGVYAVEPFTVGYWADTPFATVVQQTVLSESPYSETGWRKADFDAEFASMLAMTNEQDRDAALEALHDRMATEGGWLVWGFGDGLDIYRNTVSGLPTGKNRYDLSRVTVG